MRFNGTTMQSNRWTKWIVLCAVLFLPVLLVVNNLLFFVGYDGYEDSADDYIAAWSQDDPRLWSHIVANYVEAPSSRDEPYNLLNPYLRDYSHKRQSSVVAELFKHKKEPGVFFEAGAYDGETYSNSLYFERELNWTGVLVEPDFANLKRLRPKRRKAFVVHSCLDGNTKPEKMELAGAMEIGTLEKNMLFSRRLFTRMWRPYRVTKVWCFPIYSILAALNKTSVDYMVLDLEGSEMDVLRAIPFDKLDVKVLQIEYMVFNGAHWYKDESIVRRAELREFFAKRLPQYKEYATVFLDMIFVRRDLLARGDEKPTFEI